MKAFTIDTDNDITAYGSSAEARKKDKAALLFTNEQGLAELAINWPMSRLTDIWNGLTGMVAVKKFKDRRTGVSRIWSAIQNLDTATEEVAAGDSDEPLIAAAATARSGSKKAQVLDLLGRADGVTLADLMAATGWQKHSVRGFISGALVKKGIAVVSYKREDGQRAYRLG